MSILQNDFDIHVIPETEGCHAGNIPPDEDCNIINRNSRNKEYSYRTMTAIVQVPDGALQLKEVFILILILGGCTVELASGGIEIHNLWTLRDEGIDDGSFACYSQSSLVTDGIARTQTGRAWAMVVVSRTIPVQQLTISTSPGRPLDVRITATFGNITLSWSAPSQNGALAIAGYNIYRTVSQGYYPLPPRDSIGNTTSYVDSDVSRGQVYYYRITALDSAGQQGQPSEEVGAMVPLRRSPVVADSIGPPVWQLIAAGGISLALAIMMILTRRGLFRRAKTRIKRGTKSAAQPVRS